MNVNETKDIEGWYVDNFIIGILEIRYHNKTILFNAKLLEKTNNSTIAKLVDKYMCLLWPEGIKHDNVLFFWNLSQQMIETY